MKKRSVLIAICLIMVFTVMTVYSKPVDAAASNKALKYLKGKWYSVGMVEGGKPRSYTKFTKKYAKTYVYNSVKKKYEYCGKSKIVSTKKAKNGYLIKLKNKNGKFCYRTSPDNKKVLDCYSTWNTKDFPNYYSGTSSLFKE